MSIRFLAVDGFNLIRRIYEARHVESEQDMAQVIEAAKSSLARALKKHNPTHAAVVMEHHDKTWRHLLYPEYKANRSETPPLMVASLEQFAASFRELGVPSFDLDSYEADDVIATIATVVSDHGGDVVILSTDKIYLQLVNDRVIVYDHFADRVCDRTYVEDRYRIGLDQYIDYLALVGDKSNNIKGVPGIGAKSAASMLAELRNLDLLLATEPEDPLIKSNLKSMLRKVHADQAEALKSKQLVTLKTDVALGQNLKSFRLE